MTPRDLLEALVRVPSPSGQEADAVALMQALARADGFRVHEDAAGNFIAEAGAGSRTVLLLGHIDTVPGQPAVRVEGDVLWGRGSVDAKGPLVAFYAAARVHLQHPDLRILVVGAVDEEGSSNGARGLHLDHAPEWVIIGEPSGTNGVTIGYHGIVRTRIQAEGPVVHGGHPEPNATDRFVAWWSGMIGPLAAQKILARIDAIQSNSDGQTHAVESHIQFRLPPGTDASSVVAPLLASPFEVTIDESWEPVESDPKSRLCTLLRGAIRGAGLEPRTVRKTGTSDWNVVAARWPDAQFAAYGPGDSSLDHTPDERVDLADIDQAVAILDGVLSRLGQEPNHLERT